MRTEHAGGIRTDPLSSLVFESVGVILRLRCLDLCERDGQRAVQCFDRIDVDAQFVGDDDPEFAKLRS